MTFLHTVTVHGHCHFYCLCISRRSTVEVSARPPCSAAMRDWRHPNENRKITLKTHLLQKKISYPQRNSQKLGITNSASRGGNGNKLQVQILPHLTFTLLEPCATTLYRMSRNLTTKLKRCFATSTPAAVQQAYTTYSPNKGLNRGPSRAEATATKHATGKEYGLL